MRTKQTFKHSILKDEAGNILPMAVAGMMVMAALVGGAVDMSRAYKVQDRLQNACDAGVLAGRRAVTTNGFDAVAKAQANTYFNINFDTAAQGTKSTTFLTAGDTAGNAIGGKASTKMDMLVMQIFGKTTMDVAVNCSSTMGVGNSDIMMVLDVTGSMATTLDSTTRIGALKVAMKNFYTTLATATQGTNARVRYGFVPFSSSVNVGQILYNENPDYLVDQRTIQSRAPVYTTTTNQVVSGYGTPVNTSGTGSSSITTTSTTKFSNTSFGSSNSCNSALPANSAWANNGASSTSTSTAINGSSQQVVTTTVSQPQKMTNYVCQRNNGKYYVYYYYSNRTFYTYSYATSNPVYTTVTSTVFNHFDYKPVTYDVHLLKTFQAVSANIGTNGAAVSSTWDGCIEERQTSPAASISYSSITGMTPSDALDLDIDSAPTSDPATKWAPLWRQVAYTRSTQAVSTTGNAATSYCVPAAKIFQEMAQSSFNSYADSLTPNGYTYLDIGMLWGARLSSPDGIFGTLVNEAPANGGNVSRHIIFMTDGDLNILNTLYESYGIETLDRRITSDGSNSQGDARHSLRYRAICDAVKAKGIRIWAIGLTTGLTADLAYCASPSSSYTANTSAQLNTAFQEIAKQVGELRVLQ